MNKNIIQSHKLKYLVVSKNPKYHSFKNMLYRGLDRMPDTYGKITDPGFEKLLKLLNKEDNDGFFRSLKDAYAISEWIKEKENEDIEVVVCSNRWHQDVINYKFESNKVEYLGFDVSDHDDFSAIANGLLGNLTKELTIFLPKLNKNALFANIEDAIKLRESYMRIPKSRRETHINLEIWSVASIGKG